jgi:hypothetical protein
LAAGAADEGAATAVASGWAGGSAAAARMSQAASETKTAMAKRRRGRRERAQKGGLDRGIPNVSLAGQPDAGGGLGPLRLLRTSRPEGGSTLISNLSSARKWL